MTATIPFQRPPFGLRNSFLYNFVPILKYEEILSNRIARLAKEKIATFSNQVEYLDHGYRAGVLHESNLWQIAGNIENCKPFSIPEYIEIPEFHLGILVDCSGSMSRYSHSLADTICNIGSKEELTQPAYNSLVEKENVRDFTDATTTMNAARILCMGFTKALQQTSSVRLTIAGHTETYGSIDMVLVKSERKRPDYEKFGFLTSCAGNLDALALDMFSGLISENMRSGESGLIILICDGAPCHKNSMMIESLNRCKKLHNLTVLPIGVGSLHQIIADELYGKGNYVLAKDVISSIPNIIKKMNYMIEGLRPM